MLEQFKPPDSTNNDLAQQQHLQLEEQLIAEQLRADDLAVRLREEEEKVNTLKSQLEKQQQEAAKQRQEEAANQKTAAAAENYEESLAELRAENCQLLADLDKVNEEFEDFREERNQVQLKLEAENKSLQDRLQRYNIFLALLIMSSIFNIL